ncbi:MAG TPA: hypothetical protein ENH53_02975, partial [Bacteroidetes bacterium]|nr:hypothetical protein [Bacteroidota bacterium]
MKHIPSKRTIPIVLIVSLALTLFLTCGKSNPLERVKTLEKEGKFTKAEKIVRKTLEKQGSSLPDSTQKALLWEADRMHRVRLDYKYTQKDILEQLRKRMANFKKDEFAKWKKEGRFDTRKIDGKTYYMAASVSNLFKRYKDLRDREVPPKERALYEQAFWKNYASELVASQKTPDKYVLPQDTKITMTLTVKPNAVPAG